MWRITVAANYYIRKPKQKNRKGESPESAAYIVRRWYKSENDARAAEDELIELTEDRRDELMDEIPNAFSKEEGANVEIKSVPYDSKLIDTTEEVNDEL